MLPPLRDFLPSLETHAAGEVTSAESEFTAPGSISAACDASRFMDI